MLLGDENSLHLAKRIRTAELKNVPATGDERSRFSWASRLIKQASGFWGHVPYFGGGEQHFVN